MQIKPLNRKPKTFKKIPGTLPSTQSYLNQSRKEFIHSELTGKYRALFIVVNSEAEIVDINDHYR